MDLYELHQRTNAILSRTKSAPKATIICYTNCITLLKSKQWTSGLDLATKLIDLLHQISTPNLDEMVAMLCTICKQITMSINSPDAEAGSPMPTLSVSAFRLWAKKAVDWSVGVSEWKFGDSRLLLGLVQVSVCLEDWEGVLLWGRYCAHSAVLPLLQQALAEQGAAAKATLIEALQRVKNRSFIQQIE